MTLPRGTTLAVTHRTMATTCAHLVKCKNPVLNTDSADKKAQKSNMEIMWFWDWSAGNRLDCLSSLRVYLISSVVLCKSDQCSLQHGHTRWAVASLRVHPQGSHLICTQEKNPTKNLCFDLMRMNDSSDLGRVLINKDFWKSRFAVNVMKCFVLREHLFHES